MDDLDRIIRILVAIGIGILYFTGIVQGTLGYVLLGLSVIFVFTSFVSFCPLYSIVGLNTCKIK